MSEKLLAVSGHQVNAPAVSLATMSTGVATVLEWIPPAAGAVSSIIGLCLAIYLLKHRRSQVRIDELTERKLKADVEISERTLAALDE